MNDEHATNKQSAFRWLIGELIADYVRTGDFALVHEFLESLDGHDRESLLQFLFWYALDHLEWKLAEHCLREGYPIAPSEDELSDWGPLHSTMSLLGNRPDVIEWLIQHGAQLERRDINFMTPLLKAAYYGFEGIVAKLLASGAAVNASTQIDDDPTPLTVAAMAGHEPIVTLLMAHRNQ